MQAPALEQPPQRLAGREQVRLADELVEARGPHAVGEWSERRQRFGSHDSIFCAQPPVSKSASTTPAATPAMFAIMS